MQTPSDAHCDKTALGFLIGSRLSLERPLLHAVKVATESKFTILKPHTAFLFPGQGAQTVGMAKVLTLVSRVLLNAQLCIPGAMLFCLVVQRAMPMLCRMLWRRYLQPRTFLLRPLTSWATISSRSALRVSHAYVSYSAQPIHVGLLDMQYNVSICTRSSERCARESMLCRAKGEAGLHSHQPASHLCGQSSSSGEAAPGQRRGDPSPTTAPSLCISCSYTLNSCLSVLIERHAVFYGLVGHLQARAVCRRSSARQMWQQASAWANTLP